MPHAPNDVDLFLSTLEHPRLAEIKALRRIIKSVDPRIHEGIKWNAPSFALQEHFATFNLRSTAVVQVILHLGAKVKSNSRALTIDDPAGLITWAAKDRGIITFARMKDIRAHQTALVAILKQWIDQLDLPPEE